MKTIDVTMVRIYITESSNALSKILDYLKQEVHIRGVSVFRAIRGYGESHNHSSTFLDLSLDLPLVIEFFDDDAGKIDAALDHLATIVKHEHIVIWAAKANM